MMMDLSEKGYQRILVLLVYGLLAAGAAVLFFRFLWKPVLPFLLAILTAAVLQKPLDMLDRLTGRKKRLHRIWAVLMVLLCAGILSGLLIMLGSQLLAEGRSFLSWLGDNIGDMGQTLDGILWDIRGFLSSLPGGFTADSPSELRDGVFFRFLESADEMLVGALRDAASALTAKLPALLASFIAALPQILLFCAVFLIAAVYITADWKKIGAWLSAHFPGSISALLSGMRSSVLSTLYLYGRAYLILILITFTELYVGFRLLGVSYALGAAAIVAVIDLLPVLGTGTVLIPWALLSFLEGHGMYGVGLLLLYGVISVVRQILEPRIVGKHIGLHPLAALFSMYAGAKLFGLGGLLLFPMGTAVAVRYAEQRQGPKPQPKEQEQSIR